MDKKELELNHGKVLSGYETILAELNLQNVIDTTRKSINSVVFQELFENPVMKN